MRGTLVLSQVGDQTWGAVLEDSQVVEITVENARKPGIAGGLYRGRVTRVLPGMQSAFVDIGIERGAFLHVADLPAAHPEGFGPDVEEGEADPIATPIGELGLLGAPDERPSEEGTGPVERHRPPLHPIQDVLKEGQEILVQVAKEPIAAKGARVTAQIGLPGRLLVYMPRLHRVFVSRRIEDPVERERLRRMAESVSGGEGGWIIRTAAEGASSTALERDMAYLKRLWETIYERERRSSAPALIHSDLSLAERLLRDVVTEEFEEVIADTEALAELARAFLGRYLPGAGPRVRQAGDGWGTFDELGIHQEIERAMRSRLWLRGGGSIVVNPTEALVSIDVNTGKYVGRKDLEETALRTNLEAVREIVRLLRLRDLGGIIVIDFIDMVEPGSREALSSALSEELKKDRSRTKLLAMSDFGLVQLTRKRTRRSLDRFLQAPCSTCGGSGRVESPAALYYQIERALGKSAALAGSLGPLLRLHPNTMARLEEEGLRFRITPPPGADDAEAPPVRIEPDPSLEEGRYELVW